MQVETVDLTHRRSEMRAAVGYKSAISSCVGINMVGILSVGEVSLLSQQLVNRVIMVVQLQDLCILQILSEKHERYRYIFQIATCSQGKRSSKYEQL